MKQIDNELFELFVKSVQLLSDLKENGDFFFSAIEFNPYSDEFDGETFEKDVCSILSKIEKHVL